MRVTTAPKEGTLGLVSSGLKVGDPLRNRSVQESKDPNWPPGVTTPFLQRLEPAHHQQGFATGTLDPAGPSLLLEELHL